MKNKKGFTLVELIAIIVIVGIIIGIISPTAIKLIEKSKVNSFREGLRSIIRSAEIYMEENDLKKLPDEGIYLQDNDLDIDYSDGYSGIIKYTDGEIVLQNIGNGKYCGNGSKDTLSVSEFTEDCVVVKPEIQCFVMGTTDTAGDTIVGYDYSNEECNPTNLVIPATVNEVPVKYIADGAFINYFDYILYYSESYDEYDIKENWDAIGTDYSYALPVSASSFQLEKWCYNPNVDDWYEENIDYVLTSGDGYEYCGVNASSGDIWNYEAESTTISSVDFSNATNLVSIGNVAFYNNLIDSINFGSLSNLTNIGISVFSGNYISDTLDLSGLSNITSLGSDAFYGNNINFALLPNKLESIGYYTFGDNNLADITIPASVTSIGNWSFDDNYWNSVTIEENAENKKYRFNNIWEYIGWPVSLIPKEPETTVNYALTTSTNIFPYLRGYYNVNVQTSGNYKLEVWGAEGGGYRLSNYDESGLGGAGGYSSGIINLTAGTTLYIYTGGYGSTSSIGRAFGGYNGGGSGYCSSSWEAGNGGGGATDIRVNTNSLYARVIVAGGGGGGGEDSGDSFGYGGGTTGVGYSSYDATQVLAGTGGTFGQGGTTDKGDGGGGGGGFYGGGTYSSPNLGTDTDGGGGGSGWIYTASTFGTWQTGNPTDAANWLLNSSSYLTSAQTIAGNASMPTYDGLSTMVGNTGNGYAKITYIN
jgi:type II secretory pathway pseudopilin PulG